jgi:hypothetical protein
MNVLFAENNAASRPPRTREERHTVMQALVRRWKR